MTAPASTEPEHCGHECVCNKYIDHTNTGATPGRSCNGETWCFKPCPHDTRARGPVPVQQTPADHELPAYICDDDNLGDIHDILTAAIVGNDISTLPQRWNQELGIIRSRLLTEHDAAIREKVMDEFGILHGEAARKFNEYINDPNPVDTPEGKKITEEAMAIVQRERTALQDRNRLIREEGAKAERERVLNWMRQLEVYISISQSLENHQTAWNYVKRTLEQWQGNPEIGPEQPGQKQE